MDQDTKKRLLRELPYGLFAACTRGADGDHHVFLLSWVTQASFSPPLLACGVHTESTAYRHLTEEDSPLTINLLGEGQAELARRILEGLSFEEGEVDGTEYKEAANGCALLTQTLGAIEADVRSVTEAGDHDVIVVEVEDVHRFRDGDLLTHQTADMTYAG